MHCICLHFFSFSYCLSRSHSLSTHTRFTDWIESVFAIAAEHYSMCFRLVNQSEQFNFHSFNFQFELSCTREYTCVCDSLSLSLFYSLWPLLFGIRLLFSIIIISFDNFFLPLLLLFVYIHIYIFLGYVTLCVNWNEQIYTTYLDICCFCCHYFDVFIHCYIVNSARCAFFFSSTLARFHSLWCSLFCWYWCVIVMIGKSSLTRRHWWRWRRLRQ